MVHNRVMVDSDNLSLTTVIAEERETTVILPTFPSSMAPAAFNVAILLANDSLYVDKLNDVSLETRVLLGICTC
jgi:hypothetical protein